jgi:plastocyanin
MSTARVAQLLAGVVFAAGAWAAVPARAATIQITIDQMTFKQAKVTAKVGDTIEWINKDVVDHTATDRKGEWNVTLAPGQKGSVVLKKAGSFEYFCKYHPNMKALLMVKSK